MEKIINFLSGIYSSIRVFIIKNIPYGDEYFGLIESKWYLAFITIFFIFSAYALFRKRYHEDNSLGTPVFIVGALAVPALIWVGAIAGFFWLCGKAIKAIGIGSLRAILSQIFFWGILGSLALWCIGIDVPYISDLYDFLWNLVGDEAKEKISEKFAELKKLFWERFMDEAQKAISGEDE